MKTIDISGMGGGYENECQKLLWEGIKIIEEDPKLAEKAFNQMSAYKHIYGIVNMEGEESKEFEKRATAVCDDLTGAMVQCVFGHLNFIRSNSVEKWLAHFADDPEASHRVFDWDGTVKSCPVTELSEKISREEKDMHDANKCL